MESCRIKIEPLFFIGFVVLAGAVLSCKKNSSQQAGAVPLPIQADTVEPGDTIIVDSGITFEEAIAGTEAPKSILDELVLLDVLYKSVDNKLHQGQILTNENSSSKRLSPLYITTGTTVCRWTITTRTAFVTAMFLIQNTLAEWRLI